MKKILATVLLSLMMGGSLFSQEMDELWGESTVKLRAENAERGQLFDEGNYAMFVHWGLYSQLANKVDGKTYYGIGEWIMSKGMAAIPIVKYKQLATTFHPTKFDAREIAQLAKDAGMKYVVITSKHHDGFAMYHSEANRFNIVDATPWNKDPMKELAAACRELGLGFGFYYSHNQDWTFPGGGSGPTVDNQGQYATFDDYFAKKCLPRVEEITTQYGPIELVWFDTPGNMPKKYVQQLVDVVRKKSAESFGFRTGRLRPWRLPYPGRYGGAAQKYRRDVGECRYHQRLMGLCMVRQKLEESEGNSSSLGCLRGSRGNLHA